MFKYRIDRICSLCFSNEIFMQINGDDELLMSSILTSLAIRFVGMQAKVCFKCMDFLKIVNNFMQNFASFSLTFSDCHLEKRISAFADSVEYFSSAIESYSVTWAHLASRNQSKVADKSIAKLIMENCMPNLSVRICNNFSQQPSKDNEFQLMNNVNIFRQTDRNIRLPQMTQSAEQRNVRDSHSLRSGAYSEIPIPNKQSQSDIGIKQHICTICNKPFKHIRSLINHQQIHTGEKLYTCTVCGKSFNRKDNLKSHQHSHTDEKSYSCIVCKKLFRSNYNLKLHLILHADKKQPPNSTSCALLNCDIPDELSINRPQIAAGGKQIHKCIICCKIFNHKEELEYHHQVHSREKPYSCTICNLSFSENNSLNVHLETDHNDEKAHIYSICNKPLTVKSQFNNHLGVHSEDKSQHTCTICHKSFGSRCHLDIHRWTHLVKQSPAGRKPKPQSCPICNKTFKFICYLRTHLRTHSSLRRNCTGPCTCTICGKPFKGRRQLGRHLPTHSDKKPHSCPICNRPFRLSGTLKLHMRTHTGEKPYVCTVCKQSFSLRCSLNRHIICHTDSKPHLCAICNKSFSQKNTLKNHLFIHTGEKPYRCEVCFKTFIQLSGLKSHNRNHTGERPYACTVCNKSFNYKNCLKGHLWKCHSIDLSTERNSIK